MVVDEFLTMKSLSDFFTEVSSFASTLDSLTTHKLSESLITAKVNKMLDSNIENMKRAIVTFKTTTSEIDMRGLGELIENYESDQNHIGYDIVNINQNKLNNATQAEIDEVNARAIQLRIQVISLRYEMGKKGIADADYLPTTTILERALKRVKIPF